MITKKNFRDNTKLNIIWNKVITWNGLTLATVMWHPNPWKIVHEGTKFDTITESIETKSKGIYGFTSQKRVYTPIAEFHTQEELWQYIKPTL